VPRLQRIQDRRKDILSSLYRSGKGRKASGNGNRFLLPGVLFPVPAGSIRALSGDSNAVFMLLPKVDCAGLQRTGDNKTHLVEREEKCVIKIKIRIRNANNARSMQDWMAAA